MHFLAIGFAFLVLFPVIITVVFRQSLIERKQTDVIGDLRKLKAFELELVKEWDGEKGIRAAIESRYSPTGLFVPTALLTVFHALGFLVIWSHFNLTLSLGSPWPFARDFLMATRPVMMTFWAAYLFNAGTTIRRLYLSDLTEQFFWGGINRLFGLAVVIATAVTLPKDIIAMGDRFVYFLFFAIGSLANIFLELVMEQGMKLANINRPKRLDLPLQMIRGIDIWKEHRLEEEGVENVQNLATADIIDFS